MSDEDERDEFGHPILDHNTRLICGFCKDIGIHICAPNEDFGRAFMFNHLLTMHKNGVSVMVQAFDELLTEFGE